MTEIEYLYKVLIFLRQELPAFSDKLNIQANKIVVMIQADFSTFNDDYAAIFKLIEGCINRVRNREYDLSFTIWSANQERDFKIYK